METTFYIYRHIRPDTGMPFYVGKGAFTKRHKFERAYAKDNRNTHWQRIVAKNGGKFEVEIMYHCATEAEAFAKEIEFIALYGKRMLCNLTDGGEGHLGLPMPESRRLYYKVRFRGLLHPNFGKKLSAETCRKKSVAISGDKHFLFGRTLPATWKANIAAARRRANGMTGKTGALHHLSQRVVDTSSGVVYHGIAEASRKTGIKYQTLHGYLTEFRPNKTTLRYA